ncbi:hypothetical protein CPT_Machias_195 [Staphylococcus phage Machias]|nr:hypothetical protein CPT_Machias_195 [Staphylococcus phage Machias]WPH64273.1 hypothetical protein [Staphylococcus phage vB_StaM_PB50]
MVLSTKESQKILHIYDSLVDNDENLLSSLCHSNKGLLFVDLLYDIDYKIKEGFSKDNNEFNYIILETEEKEKLKEKALYKKNLKIEDNKDSIRISVV